MPIESTGEVVFQGGPPGPGNTIGVGTISTGPAGSQATASISGTSPNQSLNLTIPKGDQGLSGPVPWAPIVAWSSGLACIASAPATQVSYGNEAYVCTVAHTAGTFAADLAAGKWIKVAAKGVDGTNGANGVQPWQTPPAPWAASTAYTATAPASVVTYQGTCYVCSTSHTSGASFDSSKFTLIAQAGIASKQAVNYSYNPTATMQTVTAQTPLSDAVPTTSNTATVVSVSHAPKAAGNLLHVRGVLAVSLNGQGTVVGALFQGAGTNAVHARGSNLYAAGFLTEVVVDFWVAAPSQSAITFALATGCNNGNTVTVNGIAGSRQFGGVMTSHIEVEEFAA